MATRDVPTASKQLTIIIGLTVVGFMAFGLILSFYRNILFEETLQTIASENKQIATNIEDTYSELEYYRSDQYKDKFGKENLHRVNPGERVLVITQSPDSRTEGEQSTLSEQERRESAYIELLRQMPVIEHWKLFFFHRERIDELKAAL